MNDIELLCLNNESGMSCIIPMQDPFITQFISSGEILISILLLILIILKLIELLKKGINSVQILRKYQGNNSPDGKEFYKI